MHHLRSNVVCLIMSKSDPLLLHSGKEGEQDLSLMLKILTVHSVLSIQTHPA
jgi:mannose-6-phosphate isomerase class I